MPEITFAEEFGKAVRARGLSLDRLHVRLTGAGVPVSIATLSYWQSGRSKPTRAKSMRSIVELERILRVRPGTLTAYLGPKALGVIPDPGPFLPDADVAKGIVADLGLEVGDNLSRLATHDITNVGANRAEARQLTRQIFRADAPGLRRWPAVFHQDSDEPTAASVDAITYCSVGQAVTVLDRRLTVVEMLLPHELAEGEHAMVEYLTTWGPTTSPSYRVERFVASPMRELVLQVNFDPGAQPQRVWRSVRRQVDADPLGPDATTEEVPLHAGTAQCIWLDVDPGVYGIYWEWE